MSILLKDYLEVTRDLQGEAASRFTYDGIEDAILQLGTAVRGPLSAPDWIPFRKPRTCFKNAAQAAAAFSHLRYVEGWALDKYEAPTQHAWLYDTETAVFYDCTWSRGLEYYGIVFDTDYLLAVMSATGYFGVLGPETSEILRSHLRAGFPDSAVLHLTLHEENEISCN